MNEAGGDNVVPFEVFDEKRRDMEKRRIESIGNQAMADDMRMDDEARRERMAGYNKATKWLHENKNAILAEVQNANDIGERRIDVRIELTPNEEEEEGYYPSGHPVTKYTDSVFVDFFKNIGVGPESYGKRRAFIEWLRENLDENAQLVDDIERSKMPGGEERDARPNFTPTGEIQIRW